MAADFGTDVSCLSDVDPLFGLVSGKTNLAQAIARRLTTARGGLFYDESYGLDVRDYLGETFTDATAGKLQAEIEAEVEKDPRVKSGGASVTLSAAGLLTITLELDTNEGPFALVLAVSAVGVALLKVG